MDDVRAPVGIGRIGRTSLLFLIAALVAFIGASLVLGSAESTLVIDVAFYRLVFLFGGGVALSRGLLGGSQTRPWILMGVGLICYFVGELIYSVGTYLFTLPHGAPSIPDLFWLLFYPFAFLSLLFLARRRLDLVFGHQTLDSFAVGAGIFTVGVALIDAISLGPSADADPATVAVNGLFLAGDLVIVVLIVDVARQFDWRPPRTWWLLLGGLMCFAAADAITVYGSSGARIQAECGCIC